MESIILVPVAGQLNNSLLVLILLRLLTPIIFFVFLLINLTSKKLWTYIVFNISGSLIIINSIESIHEDISYWAENKFEDYYRPSGLYPLLAFDFFVICCMLILWLFKRKQKLT